MKWGMPYRHLHADPWFGLGHAPTPRLRAQLVGQRRQKSKFACSSESIVARDMAQLCKECLASLSAGAHELIQSVFRTRTRREVPATDRQRSDRKQSLIIVGNQADTVSQKLERTGMQFSILSGRPGAVGQAKDGRAGAKITDKRFAGRYRHGQTDLFHRSRP